MMARSSLSAYESSRAEVEVSEVWIVSYTTPGIPALRTSTTASPV